MVDDADQLKARILSMEEKLDRLEKAQEGKPWEGSTAALVKELREELAEDRKLLADIRAERAKPSGKSVPDKVVEGEESIFPFL